MRPNWLDIQKRQQQTTAFLIGSYAGVIAALLVAAAVGFGLDVWRARQDERRITAIRYEQAGELAECKQIVQRLGQTDYEAVVALYRQTAGR